MEDPIKDNEDVKTEDSSTSEDVNQTGDTNSEDASSTSEQGEQIQEEGQETAPTEDKKDPNLSSEMYDERGVPWKNRAMELERKFTESQANLPKLIADEIAKNSSQNQKQKYTIAELENFATQNPEHRAWAEEEKEKIRQSSLLEAIDKKMEADRKKSQDEIVRNQSFQQVMKLVPEVAIKDNSGNFIGWNNASPLTHSIGRYMNNPDLANRADGILVAAKLAYADHVMTQAPKSAKKVQKMKTQLRKAQNSQMLEGGGRKAAPGKASAKAIERLRQSGSRDDASGAMRSILAAKGVIKE